MEQRNRFRETIESGEVVLGGRAATFSPAVIERYGILGLDFVWLDFEHTGPSPWDSTVFENLTRAAETGGIELLVRIPSGDPALVRKVLDTGVRNLLVPRVDSVEEVREAVKATRFVYEDGPGQRGSASGRASSWGTAPDYLKTEDESVCLGVMIEKRGALEDLDEILSVPELGFVFVGPGDLSVQLGHPGEKGHLEVLETIADVRAASRETGVPIGKIAHDPEDARAAINEGFQIVRIGGDLEAATETLGDRLERVRGGD